MIRCAGRIALDAGNGVSSPKNFELTSLWPSLSFPVCSWVGRSGLLPIRHPDSSPTPMRGRLGPQGRFARDGARHGRTSFRTREGRKISALGRTGVPTVLETPRILDLVGTAQRAAPGVPLLIRGEPGVGKDILARLIHAATARHPNSFIKVNCGGQPEDRVEADLFGHEMGACPLALRQRLGSFEFAHHGTVYLEEIGALPRTLVPKLLYVLRTGKFSRTGGPEIIWVGGRVIASTVQSGPTGGDDDLWQELHRLNVVELRIPPLRQRRDEIPVFASFFLEQFNRRHRQDVRLCSDAMATFMEHSWPGNIRELEETVHRLVVGGAMSPVP